MKPILKCIQTSIIDYLKSNEHIQNQANILRNETFSLDELGENKFASTYPLCLLVSYPFPLQATVDVSAPCWEKLSLQCLLIQKLSIASTSQFLDLAEEISYTISHQKFSNAVWEGTFVLSENHPWELSKIKQGFGLKINFTTSNFNLLLP